MDPKQMILMAILQKGGMTPLGGSLGAWQNVFRSGGPRVPRMVDNTPSADRKWKGHLGEDFGATIPSQEAEQMQSKPVPMSSLDMTNMDTEGARVW